MTYILVGIPINTVNAVSLVATRLVVRHKVYMYVGDSPHSGRQTDRRREAKARRGHEQTRSQRHACVACEWEAERSITVTARILLGDQSLRMQNVTSRG